MPIYFPCCPPNECATNQITVGDIDDYYEDFETWLAGETIDSYTITADPALTIVSDSNNDPRIDYRIEADSNRTQGIWQQVKIIVTSSGGREETRLINFEISEAATVGGN